MVAKHFPEKTNYIPHTFPKGLYAPVKDEEIAQVRKQNFGDKADWFYALWVNRNATRKMPSDVLEAWKLFLDKMQAEYGHKKACLIMHTDPMDPEGPNLLVVQELLGLQGHVMFSTNKIEFGQMNVLHNITDTCINISRAEGFGLSTLISLQCGKPIVGLKTGGITRQLVDHRDGTEMGAAIEPVTRKMVGSQMVPYIYEDYASQEDVANGLMKIFKMSPEEKKTFKAKALDYVDFEFSYDKMIADWDRTLMATIEKWQTEKDSRKQWSLTPLGSHLEPQTQKVLEKKAPVQLLPTDHPFRKIHPSVLQRVGAKVK
jgi:glycosyltransferase involved in cell wall biosynthesis